MDTVSKLGRKRLPTWLRKGLIDSDTTRPVRRLLSELNLNTVCDGARCPNKGECYSKHTATFMILGNKCTRKCLFCAVEHDSDLIVDPEEPLNVAVAVNKLSLSYVVITSVTRDDLSDGGAGHFVETVKKIRELNDKTSIEVLVPDFKGDRLAVKQILDAGVDVFNHNVEMVKELYKMARLQADYQRSLDIIKFAKEYNPSVLTKSGLMLGLGETESQVKKLCEDLHRYKCDIVTIGQYIQPTTQNLEVEKYYTEEEFLNIKLMAQSLGFKKVVAGPLVRSSYNAFESYIEAR